MNYKNYKDEGICLIQGDCLEVLQQLVDTGVKVDCVVTDPPYETTKRGGSGTFGGMCKEKIFNDGKVFKENDIKIKKWMPLVYNILKDDTHAYIMTNNKNLQEMINCATDVGFKFIKLLVWAKDNKITGQFYMDQCEYIVFLRKGKAKRINNCGTSNLLNFPNKKTKDGNGKNIHNTEKPVDLMKVLIENSTNVNEVVLDPFMGSGSTGLACKLSNRNFIGIELDEDYFNLCIDRIENLEI